jgi:hypothetical protein
MNETRFAVLVRDLPEEVARQVARVYCKRAPSLAAHNGLPAGGSV